MFTLLLVSTFSNQLVDLTLLASHHYFLLSFYKFFQVQIKRGSYHYLLGLLLQSLRDIFEFITVTKYNKALLHRSKQKYFLKERFSWGFLALFENKTSK